MEFYVFSDNCRDAVERRFAGGNLPKERTHNDRMANAAESRVVGSVVRLKVKNLVGLGDSSRLFQKLVDRIEQSLEGVGRKHLPDGQVAILVKRFD